MFWRLRRFLQPPNTQYEASYVISAIIKESSPFSAGEDPSAIAAIYFAMLDEWELERNKVGRRTTGAARRWRSVKSTSDSARIGEETSAENMRSRRASELGEPARKRAKLDSSCLEQRKKPVMSAEPQARWNCQEVNFSKRGACLGFAFLCRQSFVPFRSNNVTCTEKRSGK